MAHKNDDSDRSREPENYEYDFFDNYQDLDGIFADRDDPLGSYGDPDAIEDLNAEARAVPMQGVMDADGLTAPAPHFDGMAILQAPARVTAEEMVCLAGPCKHYCEVVQLDGQIHRTIRRCDRVVTWAEQLKLDDVNVYGCNRHESEEQLHPAVEARVLQGFRRVRLANEQAVSITGMSLGVCHEASCEHYAVLVVGGVDDDGSLTTVVTRWCLKMGGASRPFKLDPNFPMLGCTAVKPGVLTDALDRSRAHLEKQRIKLAQRKGADTEGAHDGGGRETDDEDDA